MKLLQGRQSAVCRVLGRVSRFPTQHRPLAPPGFQQQAGRGIDGMGPGNVLQQRHVIDRVAVTVVGVCRVRVLLLPLAQPRHLAVTKAQHTLGAAGITALLLLQLDGQHMTGRDLQS